MKIILLPEALDYFNELSTLLFEKHYFGFEESALKYVDDLTDDIKKNASQSPKTNSPTLFSTIRKKPVLFYFSKK